MKDDDDTPASDRENEPGITAEAGDEPDNNDKDIDGEVDGEVGVKTLFFIDPFTGFLVDFIIFRPGGHIKLPLLVLLTRGNLSPYV
jgi:hypothetical protein